ncbi:hypothetical protein K461DRAFT_330248 [Myriangium duriaei CBS 260.36]|uniref:Heterokaryon incompatibility domain-containing protein n=1 Tax=Myriangium duriaei CBS 260.36 TaxID=1168546 RepID=A0A9P4IPA2_9PEZI|nr:hypothetical protein K461DRAFT_330248 [Myriangium duriaei CBS 260.36]
MPSFRLINIQSLVIEEFDLDSHPSYIAASHAWIDKSFPSDAHDLPKYFGGRGLKAVIHQCIPIVRYCWIDRICIKQRDRQDKLQQIPLMAQIFGQAEAVVVLINARICSALAMREEESYREHGKHWQQGYGRQLLVRVMNGLLGLSSTVWMSRVWTLQEYLLGKDIYWIGLDLIPVKINDHRIDRTRIMELVGNRVTKKDADYIYGAMSGSGVTLDPIAGETKQEAWRRWWELAIQKGNIRWMLLPVDGVPGDLTEQRNCIMPYFATRHKVSASSGLDFVRPLGSITLDCGGVNILIRRVGSVTALQRLGKVFESRDGRISRDIKLILFAESKTELSLLIATAFGGGRYSAEQIHAIAYVLRKSYAPTVAHVLNNSTDDFHPCCGNVYNQMVWDDFMQLQQSQMIGLNEGIGYLCQINSGPDSPVVTSVLVIGHDQLPAHLEALDFEAKCPDSRSVLMVVSADE